MSRPRRKRGQDVAREAAEAFRAPTTVTRLHLGNGRMVELSQIRVDSARHADGAVTVRVTQFIRGV